MQRIRILLCAATMLGSSGAAVAAESWPAIARPCAAMIDNLARLTCFDQLYASATAATARAPTAQPSAAVPAPVVATAPAATATAAAASMGHEDLKKSTAQRAAVETPNTIDARVTALREMRPRVFRITLDNGQVWQQEEVQSMFPVKVGDTVRIKKGALGRHDITRISNGKTGGWARVTRLQ